MKDNYTRQEVIQIIHEILQYAPAVIDAVSNEDTEIDAEQLLELGEGIFEKG